MNNNAISSSSSDEITKSLLDNEKQSSIGAHLPRSGERLPKEILFIVANLMLCNTLPIQILFPYLYFMVKDFHVGKPQNIGYYAGFIGSSYMVGRTISSIPWGIIADRYGRKPVIVCGMASILVFNTWFGLCKTFSMAITSRFLLGSFGALFGTVNAYAAEVVSNEQRAFSLSLISSMWGLGLVIGPSLGGYLSQPATKYPRLFTNSIFESFPYFLPPLVVSVYAFILLLCVIRLPETLHKHGKTNRETNQHSSLFRNYPFLSSNTLYCIWAFHELAYNETFSLWAVSPGGLGLSTQDVGFILAITGACLLIFQLTIFPPIANRLGPIIVARGAAVLALPTLVAYPFIQRLRHTKICLFVVIITSIVKVCLSAATTTSAFMLVNNCVRQAERGTANGISASFVSLGRALGPAVGGIVFSWAQSRRDTNILPGNQLLFFFHGVIATLVIVATFEPILPRSTNKPLAEERVN